MYVSAFSCTRLYLSINHPRAFFVQMFPAVRAQWTTPLTL